ncbi:hypothetical protein Pst134EA_031615 [Puccinia striiformis f. sp. tritici]|uniref:uncharacterized protein n=1 Tax=Puccinia striiformis f. sp. tritici TaxID=168172 RepID=UPI0020085C07|nr:uncharacterized protein Pst134EA_031615 [Puccinia striiformis f. sp. tritici]KAH9445216.1 hypothetical protein Pst134EA_031615 [Puccinia striiformis f. sp. tritici]KAH9447718.1 hypothetical protein Pst134EB_021720 [Puccinia striiformis f. sp. tritici]
MKMMTGLKRTTTSTILLRECQELRPQRRQSFMAHPFKTLRSRISSLGKKCEAPARKTEEEEQSLGEQKEPLRREPSSTSARPSFEVALPPHPRDQARIRFSHSARAQFPEDWQPSLHPQSRRNSTLRDSSNRRRSLCASPTSTTTSDHSMWPSLGERFKLFRLLVVATPSLQHFTSPNP